VAPSLLDGRGRGRPVGVDQATARVGFAGLQTVLERLQQSGEHIVVGYLLGEEQALHGVVVGEQGHHVLEQEALAVLQQAVGIVDLGNRKPLRMLVKMGIYDLPSHLGVNVHGHHVVHVHHFRAPCLRVAQQSLQLKEAGRCHQLQDIAVSHVQGAAAAAVEELHHQLEDVVADVVDLDRGRGAGLAQF